MDDLLDKILVVEVLKTESGENLKKKTEKSQIFPASPQLLILSLMRS